MGVRTLLSESRNLVAGKTFEIWEEANGVIQVYQNGNPMVEAQLSPTGDILWTAAQYAAITPVTGKFYFVGA